MISSLCWRMIFSEPVSTFPDHALAPHRPDREHGDDDRDELQQHPQPHQFLGPVRRSAPHHVKKTKQQNERNGADRDGKQNRTQE